MKLTILRHGFRTITFDLFDIEKYIGLTIKYSINGLGENERIRVHDITLSNPGIKTFERLSVIYDKFSKRISDFLNS